MNSKLLFGGVLVVAATVALILLLQEESCSQGAEQKRAVPQIEEREHAPAHARSPERVIPIAYGNDQLQLLTLRDRISSNPIPHAVLSYDYQGGVHHLGPSTERGMLSIRRDHGTAMQSPTLKLDTKLGPVVIQADPPTEEQTESGPQFFMQCSHLAGFRVVVNTPDRDMHSPESETSVSAIALPQLPEVGAHRSLGEVEHLAQLRMATPDVYLGMMLRDFKIDKTPFLTRSPCDSQGTALLQMPFDGEVAIRAATKGFTGDAPLLQAKRGEWIDVTIALKSNPFVRGRVVDTAGQPVARAKVQIACTSSFLPGEAIPRQDFHVARAGYVISGSRDHGVLEATSSTEATTDEEGAYAVSLDFTDQVVCTVIHPGMKRVSETFIAAHRTAPIDRADLIVAELGTKEDMMRVTNAAGAPIANTPMILFESSGENLGSLPGFRTSKEGKFDCRGLSLGAGYLLIAEEGDYLPLSFTMSTERTLVLKASEVVK